MYSSGSSTILLQGQKNVPFNFYNGLRKEKKEEEREERQRERERKEGWKKESIIKLVE